MPADQKRDAALNTARRFNAAGAHCRVEHSPGYGCYVIIMTQDVADRLADHIDTLAAPPAPVSTGTPGEAGKLLDAAIEAGAEKLRSAYNLAEVNGRGYMPAGVYPIEVAELAITAAYDLLTARHAEELAAVQDQVAATRKMATDANTSLRLVLLKALEVLDDGRTSLTEYVEALAAKASAAVQGGQERAVRAICTQSTPARWDDRTADWRSGYLHAIDSSAKAIRGSAPTPDGEPSRPSPWSILGAAPDWTGDETTEQHMDRVRGRAPSAVLPVVGDGGSKVVATPLVTDWKVDLDGQPDDSFRGLAHIVETWRGLDEQQRRTGAGLAPELAGILDRADRYLTWIDSRPAVNATPPAPTGEPDPWDALDGAMTTALRTAHFVELPTGEPGEPTDAQAGGAS